MESSSYNRTPGILHLVEGRYHLYVSYACRECLKATCSPSDIDVGDSHSLGNQDVDHSQIKGPGGNYPWVHTLHASPARLSALP